MERHSAGAAAAAALSLILLMLGIGLGLSSVSPWRRTALVQRPSAYRPSFGSRSHKFLHPEWGYLAGRLRTKWVAVHTDEVYFRTLRTASWLGPLRHLRPPAADIRDWMIVSSGIQAGSEMVKSDSTMADGHL